ncbi:hypothetical protein ACH495_14370 [Micromonospora sp. NPDC018662]|uniref:hypothetical protein n=1 Tax=Micromonospora sp. NPDC018662 TaxID=3364238 RepID=UPI0037882913
MRAEGPAFALLGVGNLRDGRGTLLVLPAVAVLLLGVRVITCPVRARSRRAG